VWVILDTKKSQIGAKVWVIRGSKIHAGGARKVVAIGIFDLNLANFSRIISKLKLNPTLYSNFVNGHCAFLLPN
jgi:hypothetical protein